MLTPGARWCPVVQRQTAGREHAAWSPEDMLTRAIAAAHVVAHLAPA